MARRIRSEVKDLRIKGVHISLHRRIVVHQKILSMKTEKEISIDEACIDLMAIALDSIPALKS